jgi:hypothetical protein
MIRAGAGVNDALLVVLWRNGSTAVLLPIPG